MIELFKALHTLMLSFAFNLRKSELLKKYVGMIN